MAPLLRRRRLGAGPPTRAEAMRTPVHRLLLLLLAISLSPSPRTRAAASTTLAPPCGADERVSSNACVPCEVGTRRSAGDLPDGADTECAPIVEYAVRLEDGAYLDVPAGAVDLHGSFTLELWVKRSRGNVEEILVSSGRPAPGEGLQFGFKADNSIMFDFWEGDDAPGTCENVIRLPRDAGAGDAVKRWVHWTAVYEAGRAGTPHHRVGRVYRDGAIVAECVKPFDFNGTGPLRVGGRFGGGLDGYRVAFQGDIGQVRAWTGPKSALRRRTVAAYARFTDSTITKWHPNRASLAGYWTLNENTGVTAADSSGNATGMALVDGARWVRGLPRYWVVVEDVRRSLDRDESATDSEVVFEEAYARYGESPLRERPLRLCEYVQSSTG